MSRSTTVRVAVSLLTLALTAAVARAADPLCPVAIGSWPTSSSGQPDAPPEGSPVDALAVAAVGDIAVVADATHGVGNLRVLDASNPERPTEVGRIDLPSDPTAVALAPGMAVVGHNLFIVDYCDAGGVSTIDLRDPTAPRLLGTSDFPVYHCINDVAVHDETVYVLDRNDLAVVDIEDPEHPVQVSSTMFGPDWSGLTDLLIAEGRLWAVGYGGVMCVADLAESGRFRDLGCRIKAQDDFVTIDVAGGLAGAVVDHPPPLGRRLMVLDVGVPDAPWTLSMTPTAGRAAAVSLSGRLAVVSLGLDGGMEIFDIRTASDPIELSLHQPVVADAAGLAVVGDRLWLAARREGVEIYRLDGCRAPRRPAGRRGDVDPRSVIRH